MNLKERYAFVRSMRERPDDDGLRLIFADFLEENGEAERSWLVRGMLGDRNIGDMVTKFGTKLREWFFPWHSGIMIPCYNELRRDMGFATQSSSEWVVTIHRGFISEVRLTLAQFLEHGPRIAMEHPVMTWTILDKKPEQHGNLYSWFSIGFSDDRATIPNVSLWNEILSLKEGVSMYANREEDRIVFALEQDGINYLKTCCRLYAEREADKLAESL